jgi:hypothetical protein
MIRILLNRFYHDIQIVELIFYNSEKNLTMWNDACPTFAFTNILFSANDGDIIKL